ncbi:hypothetical protein LL912_00875 [Niabella sp. CC-SYL272]|uniref:hypothetical protein n=1 Tax=Niabella agricola TaxID=2891571 RepID=UPI001F28FCB5|nr:hypothetical protein [Niabella agricola]MCF3107320.1 hypothetical protein [Niabella agricola]
MGRPRKVQEAVDQSPVDQTEQVESVDIEPEQAVVKPKKGVEYVIAQPFVDKDDFSKAYSVGDGVPKHFDEFRIESLLELGLITQK